MLLSFITFGGIRCLLVNFYFCRVIVDGQAQFSFMFSVIGKYDCFCCFFLCSLISLDFTLWIDCIVRNDLGIILLMGRITSYYIVIDVSAYFYFYLFIFSPPPFLFTTLAPAVAVAFILFPSLEVQLNNYWSGQPIS